MSSTLEQVGTLHSLIIDPNLLDLYVDPVTCRVRTQVKAKSHADYCDSKIDCNIEPGRTIVNKVGIQ